MNMTVGNNMTNYRIITDWNEFDKFIRWLPELQKDEAFYVCLLARNKYVKDIGIGTFNSDRHQCARFIGGKEQILDKLPQLETIVGSYKVKDIVVPQEALAMYMTINPRSHKKAANAMLKRLADAIVNNEPTVNVYQESITAIRKAMGRKIYTDIDFDVVDGVAFGREHILSEVKEIINPDAAQVLLTRGGFHLIVRLDAIESKYKKSWYLAMQKLPGVDITGDNMIPVPGCYQGGFTPRMISLTQF